MAVELTLKLVIENAGVGMTNINGDTIPPLTVADCVGREIITDPEVSPKAIIDGAFLTVFDEDDSFYIFDLVDAKDVPVDNAVTT